MDYVDDVPVVIQWAVLFRGSPLVKDFDNRKTFSYLLVVIEDDDEVWLLSLQLEVATTPEMHPKQSD